MLIDAREDLGHLSANHSTRIYPPQLVVPAAVWKELEGGLLGHYFAIIGQSQVLLNCTVLGVSRHIT